MGFLNGMIASTMRKSGSPFSVALTFKVWKTVIHATGVLWRDFIPWQWLHNHCKEDLKSTPPRWKVHTQVLSLEWEENISLFHRGTDPNRSQRTSCVFIPFQKWRITLIASNLLSSSLCQKAGFNLDLPGIKNQGIPHLMRMGRVVLIGKYEECYYEILRGPFEFTHLLLLFMFLWTL